MVTVERVDCVVVREASQLKVVTLMSVTMSIARSRRMPRSDAKNINFIGLLPQPKMSAGRVGVIRAFQRHHGPWLAAGAAPRF